VKESRRKGDSEKERLLQETQHEGGTAGAMPLGDHLEELRSRMLRCIIVFGSAVIVCWFARRPIVSFLMGPHARVMTAMGLSPTVKYRSYLEPFYAQLIAVSIVGVLLVSPYLIHEMWRFVGPGLFPRERTWIRKLALFSLALFLGGAAFGYAVLLPVGLRFLIVMAGPGTEPAIMISSYFGFVFTSVLFLGVAFQTPLVVFMLIRLDVLSAESVRGSRKFAILGAFIVAAVLTPPDPFTQVMLALPVILLYDAGVVIASPTKESILAFVKFVGLVALLAGAGVGYFLFWPVARLEAGGRSGRGDARAVGLRRGEKMQVDGDDTLRIGMGGGSRAKLLAKPGAVLRIRDRHSVWLESGELLVCVPEGAGLVEVSFPEGTVSVEAAVAEMIMQKGYSLRVTCISGEVQLKTGNQVTNVSEGRQLQVELGGEPVDPEEIMDRWPAGAQLQLP